MPPRSAMQSPRKLADVEHVQAMPTAFVGHDTNKYDGKDGLCSQLEDLNISADRNTAESGRRHAAGIMDGNSHLSASLADLSI